MKLEGFHSPCTGPDSHEMKLLLQPFSCLGVGSIRTAFDNGSFWTAPMMASILPWGSQRIWHLVILLMAYEYGNLYELLVKWGQNYLSLVFLELPLRYLCIRCRYTILAISVMKDLEKSNFLVTVLLHFFNAAQKFLMTARYNFRDKDRLDFSLMLR